MNRRCFLLSVVLSAAMPAAARTAPTTIAHVHGRIVSIDRQRGTFMLHHAPFALMPMSMTMEVRPTRRSQFAALHVGEIIDATIDTKIVPWPASSVTPAKR